MRIHHWHSQAEWQVTAGGAGGASLRAMWVEEPAQTITEMVRETNKDLPTQLKIIWKRSIGLEDLFKCLEKIVMCACHKNVT